jgi:condensin complex subunit 1
MPYPRPYAPQSQKCSVQDHFTPCTPWAGRWESIVLEHCAAVLRGDWCADAAEDRWFAAAQEALAVVFGLSPAPEVVCADVIKAVYRGLSGECSAVHIARFCHVIGGCALHLLVYTEALAAAVKKVKMQMAVLGSKDKDSLESELGLAAEAEIDHEQRISGIVDGEIVGRNLLAAFEPMLVRLVADESGCYAEPILREAATLALCKYMCISLTVCERHLPLLFTALQAEKHPSVRGNVMVALGDLAFRFPNAVEPWTSHIYRRLKDDSPHVRSQTLMVLTHLILNDMIKVKGQVSEMALSLEDAEPRTADLARLFFTELSKRGNNPIYNLMPDIVSRLSQDDAVGRDVFQRIMPFLFSLITKDKHSESLVEKLCFRFPTCANMAQTQDVAFCLAQLPMNEKAIKKLESLLKHYRNALFDEEVYRCFTSLVSKARKFAKPEVKEAINAYAALIASCQDGGGGVDGALAEVTNGPSDGGDEAASSPEASVDCATTKVEVEAPKDKENMHRRKGGAVAVAR